MATRKKPKTLEPVVEMPQEEPLEVMFQVDEAPVASTPEAIWELEKANPRPKREPRKPVEKKEQEPTKTVKLSTDKKAFVRDISDFISILLPRFIEMLLAFIGPEYQSLAPTNQETKDIAEPLLNVYARHSKAVATISPDYLDYASAVQAGASYGMRGYAEYQEVKTQKNRQQKMTTAASLPADEYQEYDQGYVAEAVEEEKFNKLTPEQQAQYAALQELTAQDYRSRARRSGRY